MIQFKFFKGQTIDPTFWRTVMGEHILVSDMSGEHIVNIMGVMNDGYISNPYIGKTNIEWMEIFENELRNRINGRV
jgi:hypothetical protein